MSSVNYRLANASDIDAISAIESGNMPVPWDIASVAEAVTGSNSSCFVAEIEGHIIGFAFLYTTLFDAELPDIVVDSLYRGQGVGRGLMQQIISAAQEKKLEAIFLEVRVSNQPALALYQSFGFYEYHRRKNFYKNPVEDAICMKLDFPLQ